MAHGYLKKFTEGKAMVYSAGIETHGLNPRAVATMAEDGIDISHHTSNHVDEYANIQFDFVITVCDNANENCPVFPSKAKRFHQNFTDPSKLVGSEDEIREAFRNTREDIKAWCREFVDTNIA